MATRASNPPRNTERLAKSSRSRSPSNRTTTRSPLGASRAGAGLSFDASRGRAVHRGSEARRRGQRREPRAGELEGERDAVEARRDLRQRPRVRVLPLRIPERARTGSGPEEHRHGVGDGQGRARWSARSAPAVVDATSRRTRRAGREAEARAGARATRAVTCWRCLRAQDASADAREPPGEPNRRACLSTLAQIDVRDAATAASTRSPVTSKSQTLRSAARAGTPRAARRLAWSADPPGPQHRDDASTAAQALSRRRYLRGASDQAGP